MPDVHPFGPGTFDAADAGLLATILLIAGGGLLIALMCFDAVGAARATSTCAAGDLRGANAASRLALILALFAGLACLVLPT